MRFGRFCFGIVLSALCLSGVVSCSSGPKPVAEKKADMPTDYPKEGKQTLHLLQAYLPESSEALLVSSYGSLADAILQFKQWKLVDDKEIDSALKDLSMHYQLNPMCQAKLLRVVRGAVFDVAVDIRKGSPQYAQWVGVELSAENKKQLFIPRGFAHGFLTLTDDVEVQYKADNYYSPEHDGGVRWDDPAIGVEWPMRPVILSDKDKNAPTLAERVAEGLDFSYAEARS